MLFPIVLTAETDPPPPPPKKNNKKKTKQSYDAFPFFFVLPALTVEMDNIPKQTDAAAERRQSTGK